MPDISPSPADGKFNVSRRSWVVLILVQDPSRDRDLATWDGATTVGPGVYNNKETMLWENSSAYFKKPGDTAWKRMKTTGQWTLPERCSVYLTGGEIRKA